MALTPRGGFLYTASSSWNGCNFCITEIGFAAAVLVRVYIRFGFYFLKCEDTMHLFICLHAMVKIVMQILRSYVVKYCRVFVSALSVLRHAHPYYAAKVSHPNVIGKELAQLSE